MMKPAGVRTAWARYFVIAVLLIVVLTTLRNPTAVALPSLSTARSSNAIPNIVHYVWTQDNPSADLRFEFKHFLSVYAIQYHWNPTTIHIHTNAESSSLDRARKGAAGKWSQLIFGLPTIKIHHIAAPDQAGNGANITYIEHKADFARAEVIHSWGGVYVDFDVFALRDIRPLRESGFTAVVGRIEGRQLQVNSGTLLAKRGSRMTKLFRDRMHEVYSGQYVRHSNLLLTGICEKLAKDPWEVLILDQNAFTPGSWLPQHLSMLYEPNSGVRSNLDQFTQGDRLKSFSAADLQEDNAWDQPDNLNDGPERNFFDSYAIHGFQPGVRNIPKVPGFDHISPRYVLERRSNFARAMYDVVKDMYDRGLVRVDDAHGAGTED